MPHAVGPVELAEAMRLHELSGSPYQVVAGSANAHLGPESAKGDKGGEGAELHAGLA